MNNQRTILSKTLFKKSLALTLYKFTERRWLNEFFENGSLRLGTLADFRDIEALGPHRGDAREGKIVLRRFIEDETFEDVSKDQYLKNFFGGSEWRAPLTIKGMQFNLRQESGDCFLFCTSHIYLESLFRRWHEEEGLDACYEIFDAQGFISSIHSHSSEYLWRSTGLPCKYVPESLDYKHGIKDLQVPWVKRPEYSWQHEFRLAFAAKQPHGALKPLNISVPLARRYCRPFSAIEQGVIKYL